MSSLSTLKCKKKNGQKVNSVDFDHECGKASEPVEVCKKQIEVYRGWAPPKDCEGGGSSQRCLAC